MTKKKLSVEVKNINAEDLAKIVKIIDEKNISVERILELIIKEGEVKTKMTDQKKDEEEFTENQEEKVQKYMADHKGVSYRDAVLACLDRTEPKKAKEFSAEEIKQEKQLKAVENYLDANPRATYSDACKVLFKGEKPTLEEKLIEEYMEKNPGSTYREAVAESLDLLKKEPKKEE